MDHENRRSVTASAKTTTTPATAGGATEMDDEGCRLLADFFSVLAHPIRMQLFCHLRRGRHTVSELAASTNITLQNASQQLRVMREKGVLTAEREGQSVYLSIADPRIVEAANLLREVSVAELQRRASALVPSLVEQPRKEPFRSVSPGTPKT